MGVTERLTRVIQSHWQPQETFTLAEVADIAAQEGITVAQPTVRRTLQEGPNLAKVEHSVK